MNLDPLASYVKQREGQRVIRKILLANNGMAAVKALGFGLWKSQRDACDAYHGYDIMYHNSLLWWYGNSPNKSSSTLDIFRLGYIGIFMDSP